MLYNNNLRYRNFSTPKPIKSGTISRLTFGDIIKDCDLQSLPLFRLLVDLYHVRYIEQYISTNDIFFNPKKTGVVLYDSMLSHTPEIGIVTHGSKVLYSTVKSLNKATPVTLLDYPANDLSNYPIYSKLQDGHRELVIYHVDAHLLVRQAKHYLDLYPGKGLSHYFKEWIVPSVMVDQLNFSFLNRLYQTSYGNEVSTLSTSHHTHDVIDLYNKADYSIAQWLKIDPERFSTHEELINNIPLMTGKTWWLWEKNNIPKTKYTSAILFLSRIRHYQYLVMNSKDTKTHNRFLREYDYMVRGRYFDVLPDSLFEYYRLEYIDPVINHIKGK